MKVIKHLSLIGSAALLTTPMFAKVAKAKDSTVAKEEPVAIVKEEAPIVATEKAEPQQQPVLEEQKVEKADPKDVKKEPQEVAPTKEQIASYFKTIGWMTIMQCGVKNLGYSPEEKAAFLEGVHSAMDGKEAPAKLGEIMQPMQTFLQKRTEEFEKKHQEELKMTAERNRKLGDDFMKDLLKKDGSIKTTSSGLSYKILADGDNKIKPSDEDSVEIYYTGKLIDGKVFDESKAKPITFPLNGVVPGIKEGLQLIGQGGKITLYIPDNLAYGEYDIPSIPAGSRLVFDVELVKVIKAEKAPAILAEPAKEADKATTEEKK
ncbi:MAG: FKBP-type peptidyl-prolyl cis-trans isomerase [bacterium]